MPNPLMIALPANDEALAAEFEQRLAPYADVTSQPPVTLDLETVKLVIEVVGGAVGIAANVASVMTLILTMKDREAKRGKANEIQVGAPGTRGTPLSQVDERLLRELLGVDA